MLLMLEDDADRVARFAAVARALDPDLRLVIWRSARVMVREVNPHLPEARLISLDHDLEPQPGADEDPGDGIDVARHLAALPPACPMIVHSSNPTRSGWMVGEFDLGGWKVRRVAPLGEDWIEAYWAPIVRRLLR